MEILKLNELFNSELRFKSEDICGKLYDILSLLARNKYAEVYTELYSNKDMLYQIFRDDYDVSKFLMNIKESVDKKDFYSIYDPIVKIVEKIVNKSHTRL